MPKISKIFNLQVTQYELDFIDIDPLKDHPFFLNPFVFSNRLDRFSVDSSRIVKGFFQHNLDLISNKEEQVARNNFKHLKEPNETCLGTSKKKPKGRGIGEINSDNLFESILKSKAVATGVADNLEDTAIFIPKIGRDKVSDMTTNIIRKKLIEYTQDQCALWNIPLQKGVSSGMFWDSTKMIWREEHTEMLVINNKKILLVPKGIVSYFKEFNSSKYHQHYALEFLQEDHIRRNTFLVKRTYDDKGIIKRTYVTKEDLKEKELPHEKSKLIDFTRLHPKVFNDFKDDMGKEVASLDNNEFTTVKKEDVIDHLIKKLKATNPGDKDAGNYHSLMVGILELVFYPSLINPVKEKPKDEGRKRIDICFDNNAQPGHIFHRLHSIHKIPCSYVFVECKNYSDDIANPQLEQMIGRFSTNYGRFGIVSCRTIHDKKLIKLRCSDIYKDGNGLVIVITDEEILSILDNLKNGNDNYLDEFFSKKIRDIILA